MDMNIMQRVRHIHTFHFRHIEYIIGIFIGNKITSFEKTDLEITNNTFENINNPLPKNHIKFIKKYKLELLSNFYKNHTVQFDSKSEKEAIDFLYHIYDVVKT